MKFNVCCELLPLQNIREVGEDCSITYMMKAAVWLTMWIEAQFHHARFVFHQTDIGWNPYMESWVQARPLEGEKVVLEGDDIE